MPTLFETLGIDLPYAAVRRAPAYPPLAPEVEDSLLSQLAGGGLSALGYVGSTLDKPGAALRGLLAGQPEQLLNLIPFSDALGITDEVDRVSGRDLLEQYGMLAPNTPGPDWGDVGGFGAEVLLDPLTYLTFGGSALTKAGRAAEAAGKLAGVSTGAGGALLKGARQAGIEAGQRGLVGVGLPFMDNVAIAGTGPWAQGIAGGLDKAEHWARFENPIGKTLGGLFDPGVRDAMSTAGQVEMKYGIDPAIETATSDARKVVMDRMNRLREMGYLTGATEEAAAFRSYAELATPLPQQYAAGAPVFDLLRQDMDELLAREQQLGMLTPELQDLYAKYVPRQRTQFANEAAGMRNMAFPSEHPFQTGREEFLKNIPGGTEAINRMSLDPALSGAMNNPIADRINVVKSVYGVSDDGQAKSIAEWMGSLPAEHLQKKIPVFGNHPVYDILNRFVAGERAQAATSGIYEFIKKNMTPHRTPGSTPVSEVLAKAGLDAKYVSPDTPMFLADEYANDISRLLKGFTSPEPAGMVIAALDKFTNAFKVSALTKPSRWVRDFYSGQFMNWVTGLFSPRGLTGAHSIMTQGLDAVAEGVANIPEFAARGLNPQQATQEIVKELFAHQVIQPFGGEFADLAGQSVSGSKLLSEIPGGVPQTLRGTFIDPLLAEGRFNPLRTRGVGQYGKIARETQFAPVKISENVSHYTDGLNRIAPYIEARLQGMAPAVAARKVKLAQVDYSRLTTTERQVLKRALPFYTFTRRMIPKVFGELMEKPGGRLAQTIRAENLSRDDQFLPPYLAPGLAVRLPESLSSGTGDARYVTSIDLPHESVFQLFRPSNTVLGTLEQTGLGLLGMLNPVAKAPAEIFTGKQFYSGRDLADLDSRIGRLINPETPPDVPVLLDQLMMNLPITSPLMTTLGTALDPRKGAGAKAVNLLSGVKISDVDVSRSKDRIARDAIEEMMRGNEAVRTHSSMYVPRELVPTLTEDEQLLMSAYNSIRQRGRERAQEKRQNAGAGRL